MNCIFIYDKAKIHLLQFFLSNLDIFGLMFLRSKPKCLFDDSNINLNKYWKHWNVIEVTCRYLIGNRLDPIKN